MASDTGGRPCPAGQALSRHTAPRSDRPLECLFGIQNTSTRSLPRSVTKDISNRVAFPVTSPPDHVQSMHRDV